MSDGSQPSDGQMDFVCYTQAGWQPQIRPASSHRDWMDATPESFATRCLPLNIANAHGWEIVTPAGFSAYWRGGSAPEDVIIQPDPDMPPLSAPVRLFGQATFTIHIQGIFRTPPGWNLFVSGSPNFAKDGLTPLSALVETDWSPYTFTMNWRFTRRGHWVRFDAGEPICFVFPVQRGILQQFKPRLAPISDDPELAQQFSEWSRSRDAFRRRMIDDPPALPADKWQKNYFRGLYPSGQSAAIDHQTKLRLAPFAANS